MQNKAFSEIAFDYDHYSGASYDQYCDFILKAIKERSAIEVCDILDLGCGTAELTHKLSEHGYGMIGVDNSAEMLSKAKEKYDDILLLEQDMREFELYGTVQAAICTYDGLNYLNNGSELKKVFALLHNYIEPDGLFVFDVNTLYKYENVLSCNSFVYEKDEDMLVWQNYYDQKNKRCDFYLTLFERNDDGSYVRSDEFQRQKYFSDITVKRTARASGFETLEVFGGLDGSPLSNDSEKAFYVMKRGAL